MRWVIGAVWFAFLSMVAINEARALCGTTQSVHRALDAHGYVYRYGFDFDGYRLNFWARPRDIYKGNLYMSASKGGVTCFAEFDPVIGYLSKYGGKMDPEQMKEHVIEPALKKIGLHSKEAVNLLMGTAAQESLMGKYVKQIRGPALSVFQIEPRTHDDLWTWMESNRPALAERVRRLLVPGASKREQLIWNLHYAAAMARVFYLRIPKPLPAANDVEGHARYWKTYYNTRFGKGTEEEFVRNWRRFVERLV